MLKNITNKLLDPTSEKALAKALENLDMDMPDQRQALAHMLLEHQQKLSGSETLKHILDPRLLFEVYFDLDEKLQEQLNGNIAEAINKTNQDALLEKLLESWISLKKQPALVLFSSFSEHQYLNEKAIGAMDLKSKKQVLLEGKSDIAKAIIINSIKSLEDLKTLEKETLNKDKKSTRLIQQAIQHIQEAQEKKQALLAERERILEAFEALAKSPYAPLYESKRQHLNEAWQALVNTADTDIIGDDEKSRIARLDEQCLETINTHEQETQKALQKENDKIFLESAMEKLDAFFKTETLQTDALDALLNNIKTKLDKLQDEAADFDHRKFQAYLDAYTLECKLSADTALLDDIRESLAELSELFSSNHKRRKAQHNTLTMIREKLGKLHETLENAPKISGPGLRFVKESEKKLKQFEKQSRDLQEEFRKKFDKKTAYIKTELENKELTTVKRLYRESEELLTYCPAEQQESLQSRLAIHHEDIKSLEDWYNFATLPKRKTLLDDMQALAKEAPRMKIRDLKEKIKNLQAEWKTLGHARDDEGKKIWTSFQEAGDLAYQPVKKLIEKKEQEKLDNLAKRQEILEKLSDELDRVDKFRQDKEWIACEKLIRKSQAQWQQAFPVPAKQEGLQKRFDELLLAFNEKLLPQRKINQGRKTSLLAEAAKLEKINNNRDAVDAAKKLQEQWKEVGFSEEDETLWQEFRLHCDKVFERRDQIKNEQKSQQQENLAEAKALCLALENIETDDAEQFEQQLRKLSSQFDELKLSPKHAAGIHKQFAKARKIAQQSLKQLKDKHRHLLFESLVKLCRDCASIEKALIEGTMDKENALQEYDALVSDTPVSSDHTNTLRQSLIELADSENKNAFVEERSEQLKKICVALEIDLDIDSPPQDKDLRMEVQVQRLNKKFNQSDDQLSSADKIKAAYLLGGVFSYQENAYAQRLMALNEALNKRKPT